MLLRCESLEPPMSQLGQNPTPPPARVCLLPPSADVSASAATAIFDHPNRASRKNPKTPKRSLPRDGKSRLNLPRGIGAPML